MSDRSHDTLVYRLAQMLVKLNQGERLDPQAAGGRVRRQPADDPAGSQ